MMFTVRVPATTANLGPGFDSLGLSLSLYLTVEVVGPSTTWTVLHDLGEDVPTDETNLIVETALSVVPTLTPYTLKVTNEIPLTRGLGSSASAIVAGLEIANQLGHLNLSQHQKVEISSRIEGHPDNVAPAILGNFVVGMVNGEDVFYTHHSFPVCDIIALIPATELKTTESRRVLPEEMTFQDTVKANAICNVLVSALVTGEMELAGELMERDILHEPFRSVLVPHLEKIRTIAKSLGSYSTVLSGAGPCVLVFTQKGTGVLLQKQLEVVMEEEIVIQLLDVDTKGVQVTLGNMSEK